MRRGLHWLILLVVLAACSTEPESDLPRYARISSLKPLVISPTPQVLAMNATLVPTVTPTELIEPASVNLDAVIAPATFTATPIPALGELTLPPSFTPTHTSLPPTFTATATITSSATASPTITDTPIPTNTPYRVPSPFPEHEESRYKNITYNEAHDLLLETPLLLVPEDHIQQVFARGQVGGLNDRFLLSVGDCNSESHWYLQSLLDDSPPQGEVVDINFYQDMSIQSVIETYSDAFAFKGQSVNSGLNAMSVMDPFWANPNLCPPGTSPLDCDFQQTRPFAALIMFGANDIKVLNTAGYEAALRDIIEFTLQRDTLPILSTFTVRQLNDGTYEQGVRFNGVVVKLAEEYNVPLVNFWLAAREADGYGILNDNAHLTVDGFNIRNRLTLDMLNTLRRDVLSIGDEI